MPTLPTTRAESLTQIERAVAEVAPLYFSEAAALARPYAPGKWTGRQVLAHLADAQHVMLERLCRIVGEDEPPLVMNFDENKWTQRLAYDRRDIALLGHWFTCCAATILDLVRALPVEVDARYGIHSTAGKRTFLDQLRYVGWHALHHGEQARAAIAGKTWSPAVKG